jgi:uncharacterized membrane protein YgcG
MPVSWAALQRPRTPGVSQLAHAERRCRPGEWVYASPWDACCPPTPLSLCAPAPHPRPQPWAPTPALCPLPAQPVTLADFGAPGADLPGVHVLRSVADADVLLGDLAKAKAAGGKVGSGAAPGGPAGRGGGGGSGGGRRRAAF